MLAGQQVFLEILRDRDHGRHFFSFVERFALGTICSDRNDIDHSHRFDAFDHCAASRAAVEIHHSRLDAGDVLCCVRPRVKEQVKGYGDHENYEGVFCKSSAGQNRANRLPKTDGFWEVDHWLSFTLFLRPFTHSPGHQSQADSGWDNDEEREHREQIDRVRKLASEHPLRGMKPQVPCQRKELSE